MGQKLLLLRRKIKHKKVIEENKEHISVSDSLSKQLAKLEETNIVTEIKLIEPLFVKFKISILKGFLKSRIFKLNILPEFFHKVKYKSIVNSKSSKYILNIRLYNFKPIKILSYDLLTMKFMLFNPVFSRISVFSYVETPRRYLLHNKVLFMEHKVKVNLDIGKLIDMIEPGSSIEYKVLGEVDLEYILAGKKKDKGIWFGGSKYIGEPIIFIVNDDLWYLIAELCKEFYRETRGEFPKPHVINIEENEDLEKFMNLVELGEKVAKDIIVLRLLGKEARSYINSLKFKKVIRRIINELFSQGLGFLILAVDPRSEDMSYTLDELENKIIEEYTEFYIPRLIKVKALSIETIPIIEEFVRLVYGIREFIWRPTGRNLRIIGYRIAEAERQYRDLVDNTLRFNEYLYKVKLHKVGDKKESEDHLALKTLVVKNLVEKYNIDLDNIETEYPIKSNGEVVADVYVKSLEWAIEVETLFGTGAAPILKIRDTVLKYEDIPHVRRIWVVIRNMPVTVHFRDLIKLLKYLREKMKNKEIEFYVLNMNGSLINILEIRKRLLHILGKASFKYLKNK